MTSNLAPDAAELFEPVLKWLDAGAPHMKLNPEAEDGIGFNMLHFINERKENQDEDEVFDYSERNCGTTCCIAGAVDLFNNLGIYAEFRGTGYDVCTSVGQRLGMNSVQIDDLFIADNFIDGNGCRMCMEEIDPYDAAAAIRSILKTGRVVWPGSCFVDLEGKA